MKTSALLSRTVEESLFMACYNGDLPTAHKLQSDLSEQDCARMRQAAQNILAFVRKPRPGYL